MSALEAAIDSAAAAGVTVEVGELFTGEPVAVGVGFDGRPLVIVDSKFDEAGRVAVVEAAVAALAGVRARPGPLGRRGRGGRHTAQEPRR